MGLTLNDKVHRHAAEVMDDFRASAKSLDANLVNGLFMKLEDPGAGNGAITIHYNDYEADAKVDGGDDGG